MDHNTFIVNLIRLCADEDGTLPDRLRFYTIGKEITCWVDVSDVFEWGTADTYTIEHVDLAELALSILDPNDALVLLVCKRRNKTPTVWFLKSHPEVEAALK